MNTLPPAVTSHVSDRVSAGLGRCRVPGPLGAGAARVLAALPEAWTQHGAQTAVCPRGRAEVVHFPSVPCPLLSPAPTPLSLSTCLPPLNPTDSHGPWVGAPPPPSLAFWKAPPYDDLLAGVSHVLQAPLPSNDSLSPAFHAAWPS